MDAATTLFDAYEAGYSATVEVLGVVFRAEDDGYAVLEVEDLESGEESALVGRQLHAQGALPLGPADREGQIVYLTSLRATSDPRGRALRSGPDRFSDLAT